MDLNKKSSITMQQENDLERDCSEIEMRNNILKYKKILTTDRNNKQTKQGFKMFDEGKILSYQNNAERSSKTV